MPKRVMDSVLDDIFDLLKIGTVLEDGGDNRIEAATKYYEAVYLMRQYLAELPFTAHEAPKRKLLNEKIDHYSSLAAKLLADDSSTISSLYHEDTSTVTAPSSASPRFTQSSELNTVAGMANTSLGKAIQYDENQEYQKALGAYLEAAELYLQAIKSLEDGRKATSPIHSVLVRRLEGALDRIEQLKLPQPLPPRVEVVPESRSKQSSLTKDEIEVLKRSSLIASGLFLPWSDQDAHELSRNESSKTLKLFTDPNGMLALSPKQLKRFHKWARPNEIVRIRQSRGRPQKPVVMIRSISPYTIQQQYVTDCSFIASLCICALGKFRKRLITSIIFPQDVNSLPVVSPSGKYIVKLWLNGVARQVIVDDYLPIDDRGNLLCSQTSGSHQQLELWVPIIEKAYMKLCGGYNFPGSNSGVDLFSLTGWIPERIFFAKDENNVRDFETAPERAFARLHSANTFGDCLITVSTTRDMTEEQAESLGLITGHAYAVLNVIETKNGTRLLQMKNPWASKSWQGKFSSVDREGWQDPKLRQEVGYNPEMAAQVDDGVFYIEWTDVLKYFQNVQLSWNPALFAHRTTIHGLWKNSERPSDDCFTVGFNPQYILTLSDQAVKNNASLWVLLSRHVTKQEQEGEEATDFLTVHMVRSLPDKERVWYAHSKDTLVHGAYTNNPHCLVRYDVSSDTERSIALVLSQYQQSGDLGYTLSVFSTEEFQLGKPHENLPHVVDLVSTWTNKTAGGPMGQETFFRNPMWSLELDEESQVQIRCFTKKKLAGESTVVLSTCNTAAWLSDRLCSDSMRISLYYK